MTETLAEKKCTPCRGGIPPLTQEEAERFQSQTPNWELRDHGHRIERTFRFRNFQEALGFVGKVGDLAETEGHHAGPLCLETVLQDEISGQGTALMFGVEASKEPLEGGNVA